MSGKPGPPPLPPAVPARRRRPLWPVLVLCVALGLIPGVIRFAGYEAFRIPSESMYPSLLRGDHIFVSKSAYGVPVPFSSQRIGARLPERGDIIVFRRPGQDDGGAIIKRVIGLPGDRVQVRDRHVIINGEALPSRPMSDVIMDDDGDLPTPDETARPTHYDRFEEAAGHHRYAVLVRPDLDSTDGEWTVKPDHLFVLGDNRDNALDSRFGAEVHGVGQVPTDHVMGRAGLIWFSISQGFRVRWSRMMTTVP